MVELLTTRMTSATTKSTRPTFYKLKQDINDFNYLYIEHQDKSIDYFDYYMEFSPVFLKKIFHVGFLLNKLLIIILVYCVFYNTIWWYKNSASNNLAINYQIIDSNVFFMIIYFNFHDFLVNTLLLRTILFNLMKFFHVISTPKLKTLLNILEVLFKLVIIIVKFLYLTYFAQFTIKFTLLFILPHVYFLIYYSFNYEIKILNYVLLTNNFISSNSHLLDKFIAKQQHQNNLTTTQSTTAATEEGDLSIFGKIYSFFKSIPKTSHIQFHKINLFSSYNINNNTYSTPSTPTTVQSTNAFQMPSILAALSSLKHNCIKDTIGLREETEIFSKVFNSRFKETCLRTFEIVFYNLIIPRLCVPEYINTYKNFEFYSYVYILITSTFISYWLYYVPISSLISLNRNAEHLGEWKEYFIDNSLFDKNVNLNERQKTTEETDNLKSSSNICCWFDTKFYFKGDSISFMGKYYRVESKFCISIPDYKLHKRFYKYFNDPFRIVTILALFKLSCIVLLGLVTYYEAKWYNIAVNMLYVIFNFHILYILTRDWIILYVKKYAKLNSE